GKTYEESVDELYKILLEFCHLEKEKRVRNKIQAKTIASKADWKILIDNYIEAHNLAVEKVFG
ncbi:hypothetical protein JXA85_04550, partial [Candidatus Woesearchaeota archaeon]|nr:hypothetical protein [Candidatus Woesearchaeota archaeon]